MKNCIILGSGRSGTSMVAGMLAKAGYFMGDNLYPPRKSNPKGFFEDPFINGINEEILAKVQFALTDNIKKLLTGTRLRKSQRWLEVLPIDVHMPTSKRIEEKIITAVTHSPYCFKDPRFSYTLPVWWPYLKETVFICIFREPNITAQSIVKECAQMKYLQSVTMTFELGMDVWFNMYNHILQLHMHKGEWLFIHYDQILSGEGLARIEAHTQAIVDRSFPDNELKRTTSGISIDNKFMDAYMKLCKLSGYVPAGTTTCIH
jgi:hypothetical protein